MSTGDNVTCEKAKAALQERGIRPAAYGDFILRAAYEGDVALLKLLMQAGADVNTCRDGSLTPLIIAAAEGYTACVEQLLESDAIDVNFADEEGKTALYHAAESGYAACVKLLLEDPDTVVDATADADATPLGAASKNGHEDCVRLLRAAGFTQAVLPPVPPPTMQDLVHESKRVVGNYLYKWSAIVCFVIALGALAISLAGFGMFSKSTELKKSGIPTQGLVIDLYNKGQATCNPTVRFVDAHGQQHEARSISGVAEYDRYEMHQSVPILYSPQDPQTMEIVHNAGYAHYYILMAGGGVGALIFVVLGFVLLKKRRKV